MQEEGRRRSKRALLSPPFCAFFRDIVVLGSDFVPILDREETQGREDSSIFFLLLSTSTLPISPQDQLGSRDSNPCPLALAATQEERTTLRIILNQYTLISLVVVAELVEELRGVLCTPRLPIIDQRRQVNPNF